jgi:hypothetical protein
MINTLTLPQANAELPHDDKPVLFTGEMIFPWMFEDIAALRPLKPLADALAQADGWSKIYDSEVLKRNEVPVAAAVYCEVLPSTD